MNNGPLLAFAAYALWGVFPLYFHLLGRIGALEVVSHRIVWACGFMVLYLALRGRLAPIARGLTSRLLLTYGAAALLISINWGVFIYAVGTGRTLESSLGYFLSPLLNVLLGALVFGERLAPVQRFGVALAAAGALVVGLASAAPPWIALALAGSFGLYSLVKKQATLPAAEGMALETALLLPLAGLVLATAPALTGSLAFGRGDRTLDLLLIGSGPVTLIPLLLFAAASKRTSLSTLGMVQYIAPSGQFLVGYLAFREPLGAGRLGGFALVWAGLAVYTWGMLAARKAGGTAEEGAALRGRVESLRFPVQLEATRAFVRMEGAPPSKPPGSDVAGEERRDPIG